MFPKKSSSVLKKWITVSIVLLLVGAGIVYYLFTLKHEDTIDVKADYTLSAATLISEFERDIKSANNKYSEKIITVDGIVSEIEMADTSANIKMADDATGAYIIFAFQQQHAAGAKNLKVGDAVVIKGSCSNGAFSNILETTYITFKRCAVIK